MALGAFCITWTPGKPSPAAHRMACGTTQTHESQGSAPGSTLNWIENSEQWIPLQAGPSRPATSPLSELLPLVCKWAPPPLLGSAAGLQEDVGEWLLCVRWATRGGHSVMSPQHKPGHRKQACRTSHEAEADYKDATHQQIDATCDGQAGCPQDGGRAGSQQTPPAWSRGEAVRGDRRQRMVRGSWLPTPGGSKTAQDRRVP